MTRVKEAAVANKTKTIDDDMVGFRKEGPFRFVINMFLNFKWMLEAIHSGHDFLDIGIDVSRPKRSWFYRLEKAILWWYTH